MYLYIYCQRNINIGEIITILLTADRYLCRGGSFYFPLFYGLNIFQTTLTFKNASRMLEVVRLCD